MIADRIDLRRLPSDPSRRNQHPSWPAITTTTATGANAETSRSLYGSNAGLLLATTALGPNSQLSNFISTATSTDPGVVLLRDLNGDPISSDGTDHGYFIDGQSIISAEALTEQLGNLDVTTGFQVLIKDNTGKLSAVQFDTNGYRVSMDAASITETLNIHINSGRCSRLTGEQQPSMSSGTEDTDYTFTINDLTGGF